MQVKISARHGHLDEEVQAAISQKAEKLLHFFDRITFIEVVVDLKKTQDERCPVEIIVQAEHKHDFVATEAHADVLVAFDQAMHKMEGQLRRYKEKIQDHRRSPHAGEMPRTQPEQ